MLFIVSAPSGTGKTTVVERLVKVTDRLKLSRSYTSRAPRGDEADGVDYNFVSRERFEAMVANGEFLEYADVFGNSMARTPAIRDALPRERRRRGAGDRRAGRAEGAARPGCRTWPSSCCRRPTRCSRRRLRGRSKDSDEAMRRRLEVAREEVSAFEEYDYVVHQRRARFVRRAHQVDRAGRALEAASACGRRRVEILRTFRIEGDDHGHDCCRRVRRNRRLQVGRSRARPAEAGARRRRRHDALRRRFVGELTFEAITRHRVLTSQFEPGANSDIEHISLASSIDLLLVAPATANIIGKFANGIADDFLTSLYLATKAPVLDGAGDEHEHARARRPCSGTSRRCRHAGRISSIRAPDIWRAAGLARDGSRSRRTS